MKPYLSGAEPSTQAVVATDLFFVCNARVMTVTDRPRLRDHALVFFFAVVLFGYAGFSGRPLTMHEARLPETSREMLAGHNWLLLMSGGRYWLERPPLPHWIVATAMVITHRTNAVWVVRLPSALCGALTAVLVVYMAGAMFGRTIGIVSGLVLCTCIEFYQYASLAEDDIYLGLLVAACMALVVRREFARQRPDLTRGTFFGNRAWELWLFFILLALTNLTKGPLLGMIVVAPAVGVWALWQGLVDGQWPRFRRYVWAWGWVAAILIGAAWPWWAYHRVPDVLDNWKYDYLGRLSGAYTDINAPPWYYLPTLAGEVAPWTPVCLLGLLIANHRLRHDPDEAGRAAIHWVISWAVVPLMVLSIPKGKHHHYLIPLLAPWAMLAGLGATWLGRTFLTGARSTAAWTDPRTGLCFVGLPLAVALAWFHPMIPAPQGAVVFAIVALLIGIFALWVGFRRASGLLVLAAILGLLAISFDWIETYLAARTDQTVFDTAFLQRVRGEAWGDIPLFINATPGNPGNLDFFRIQFYSRPDARLIQNLTFLRDEKLTAPVVYVITRARDEAKLAMLGNVRLLDQSPQSHEIPSPAGRFSLFELRFAPDLKRYPLPDHISSLQAMERAPGPWCGPRL